MTSLQRLSSAVLLAIVFGCASGAILPLVLAKNCCPLQAACCRNACAMKKKAARSCGAAPSRVELQSARWVALLDDAEEPAQLEIVAARSDATPQRTADGFVRRPEQPPRVSSPALA